MPRNPRIRYHFHSPHFEFFFQWAVGGGSHGIAEAGECFAAASRIRDGDPESWVREWSALADRVERRASESRAGGHRVSAAAGHLRAYTYRRAALVFLDPRLDPRFRALIEQARTSFRRAASLMDPPLDPVSIPFEDAALPGYFRAARCAGRHPTLIMVGGGDTFVEDLYGYIGPPALARGYNLMLVDLPGQGTLPFEGLPMRPDAEVPVAAVIDHVLTRPEVDADRLAAFGLSAGGYLVPRAATRERRLKACVASAVILDFRYVWGLNARRRAHALPFRILRAVRWPSLTVPLRLAYTYCWRWGAETFDDLYDKAADYHLDPEDIACPVLNVVSEQEYRELEVSRRWAEACLHHPRSRLVVTPADEGAGLHGVGTNLSLLDQVVFDWLDEVLGAPAP